MGAICGSRCGAGVSDWVSGMKLEKNRGELDMQCGNSKTVGVRVFSEKFKNVTSMIVGEGGISIADFLLTPIENWLN